jgi:hypothetical protein
VTAPVGFGLGLRVKLGWAVAVAVDVDPASGAARVVGRGEPRLDPSGGIFGYHAAMEAEPEDRASVVAAAAARAADAATDELADTIAAIEESVGGAVVASVGVVVGRGVRRIPLDRILTSSQLFHTAEAEVIQDGFAEAARRLGLPVVRVTVADAEADDSWPHIDGLAQAAGRPWRKDEKLATVAAWRALRSGRGAP